jgi:hypothetical protein
MARFVRNLPMRATYPCAQLERQAASRFMGVGRKRAEIWVMFPDRHFPAAANRATGSAMFSAGLSARELIGTRIAGTLVATPTLGISVTNGKVSCNRHSQRELPRLTQ